MADTSWQNNFNSLEGKQNFMFNNDVMADVYFKVKDDIFGDEFSLLPAHKYVLASSSEVFYAMFYGDLAISNNDPILIPDISTKLYLKFLKYIYTYNVEFKNDTEEILSILYTAKKYIMPNLALRCTEYIKMIINADNVCIYLMKSKFYGENELMQECWNFIKFQAEAVLASYTFYLLDHETLCEFLTLPQVNVCTERIIYEGIVKWAHFHCHHDNLDKDLNVCDKDMDDLAIQNDYIVTSYEIYPLGGCHALMISPCIADCLCCAHCYECSKQAKPFTCNQANKITDIDPLSPSLRVTPSQLRTKLGSALFLIRFGEMSLEDFSDGPAVSNIISPKEVIEVYLYHHGTSSRRRLKDHLHSENLTEIVPGGYNPKNRHFTFKADFRLAPLKANQPNISAPKSLVKPCRTKPSSRARPHSICTVGAILPFSGNNSTSTFKDGTLSEDKEVYIPTATATMSNVFPCLINPRPRPPLGICSRFGRCSSQSSWRYDGRARDSIQFSVDRKILFVGLGLYGSSRHLETPFAINAKLFQCGSPATSSAILYNRSLDDNYEGEGCSGVSILLLEECIQFTSTGSTRPYHVTFKNGAVTLNCDTPYLLSLVIRGGDENNYYGQDGSACVIVNLDNHPHYQNDSGKWERGLANIPFVTAPNVRFTFEISTEGSNGTSVQGGQIPQLLFYCY